MFVLLWLSDCVRSSGVDYRGAHQISSSGLACLNWTNATRDYDVLIHPDSQTGKQLAPVGSKSIQIIPDAVKSSDKNGSLPFFWGVISWCESLMTPLVILHQPAASRPVFPYGIVKKPSSIVLCGGVGDHSYCRNPDNSERPWCYIAGPDGTVQRQLCTIDTCTGRNILQKVKTKKKVLVLVENDEIFASSQIFFNWKICW